MGAVTLFAAGSVGVALSSPLAVDAGGVLGLLIGMAQAAIHAGELFGVGNLFDVDVAGDAFQRGVRRGFERGGMEAGRHTGLAPADAGPGIVTTGAVFVFRSGRRLGRENGGHDEDSQTKADERCRCAPESHLRGLI